MVLHADRRLADRPVVPDVGGPVTDLGSAERQVLEFAREGVEVFTFTEVAGLDVQFVVEELMLNPQLGQTHHVATTVDFLGRTQGAGTRVADTVVGDVLAVTIGELDLGLGVVPAEQFFQVQRRAQAELVGVARGLVIVEAAMQVAADFTDVVHLDVDALLDQLGTLATPIARHPLGVRAERFIGHRIAGQNQCCRC